MRLRTSCDDFLLVDTLLLQEVLCDLSADLSDFLNIFRISGVK